MYVNFLILVRWIYSYVKELGNNKIIKHEMIAVCSCFQVWTQLRFFHVDLIPVMALLIRLQDPTLLCRQALPRPLAP